MRARGLHQYGLRSTFEIFVGYSGSTVTCWFCNRVLLLFGRVLEIIVLPQPLRLTLTLLCITGRKTIVWCDEILRWTKSSWYTATVRFTCVRSLFKAIAARPVLPQRILCTGKHLRNKNGGANFTSALVSIGVDFPVNLPASCTLFREGYCIVCLPSNKANI